MHKLASLVLVSALAVSAGCSGSVKNPAGTGGSGGSSPTGPGATASSGSGTSGTLQQLSAGGVSKIDLLLMVDNSRSMGDKQPACFPKALTPDASGQVACTIVAASKSSACSCDAPGRAAIPASDAAIVAAIKQDPLGLADQWNCFCEIPQASGAALKDCQTDPTLQASTNGWCYVDAMTGDPALVASCPSAEPQRLRFAGAGAPAPGETTFLDCQ